MHVKKEIVGEFTGRMVFLDSTCKKVHSYPTLRNHIESLQAAEAEGRGAETDGGSHAGRFRSLGDADRGRGTVGCVFLRSGWHADSE